MSLPVGTPQIIDETAHAGEAVGPGTGSGSIGGNARGRGFWSNIFGGSGDGSGSRGHGHHHSEEYESRPPYLHV